MASADAKRDYLTTVLAANLTAIAGSEAARSVAAAWTGGHVTNAAVSDNNSITLPRTWDGSGIDLAFVRELEQALMDPRCLIVGTSDGDTGEDYDSTLDLPREINPGRWIARREPDGIWVLFNRETGARMMLSFARDGLLPGAAKPRTATPLLVDVKLTDACPFRCAFCYMNSLPDGRRGDPEFLAATWDALAAMQVFEVALGGGEPTLDPDFETTLAEIRESGMVPNFTTKTLHWLKDAARREAILEQAGAFAYSVESAAHIQDLGRLLDCHAVSPERASVQVVMGMQTLDELEDMLTAAATHNLRVTLLGYKQVGRGPQVTPEPYAGWIERWKKLEHSGQGPILGIDTALAAESQTALDEAGVPRWSYHVDEGRVSMYIDAVTRRIAPSSYVPPEQMLPAESGTLEATIRHHYAAWAESDA